MSPAMINSMQTFIAENQLSSQSRRAGIASDGHLFGSASKREQGSASYALYLASVANAWQSRGDKDVPFCMLPHEQVMPQAAIVDKEHAGKRKAATVSIFCCVAATDAEADSRSRNWKTPIPAQGLANQQPSDNKNQPDPTMNICVASHINVAEATRPITYK